MHACAHARLLRAGAGCAHYISGVVESLFDGRLLSSISRRGVRGSGVHGCAHARVSLVSTHGWISNWLMIAGACDGASWAARLQGGSGCWALALQPRMLRGHAITKSIACPRAQAGVDSCTLAGGRSGCARGAQPAAASESL